MLKTKSVAGKTGPTKKPKHSFPTLPQNPQIKEDDATESPSWGVTVPNGANDTIILPSTSLLSFVARPSILQRSSDPSLAANVTLEGVFGGGDAGLGVDGGNVTVDTTPPEVDVGKGVKVAGDGNGTYASGETVFITVW